MTVPDKSSALPELLRDRWQTEDLTSTNDKCEACQQRLCRQKTLRMIDWPRTLVLHLKRWDVLSIWPYLIEKKSTPVSFDFQLPVPDRAVPYMLRAVVVHRGVAEGGHYTAFVKSVDENWYYCDDNVPPQLVSPGQVLAAEAYLMFYE